mgnify:CR=1 FL=1
MPHSQNPGFPLTRKRTVIAALLFRLWRVFQEWLTADRPGYAPDSSTPPWGWPLTLLIAIAVCGLLFFGPTLAARAIGS